MDQDFELDDVDRGILRRLLGNARTTNASIARDLDVAESTIASRISKLEAAGVIEGYTTRVDRQALGLEVHAFVKLDKAPHIDASTLEDKLSAIPHLNRLHRVSGEHFWQAEICADNAQALSRVLDEQIHPMTGVECVRQEFVLSTILDGPVDLVSNHDAGPDEGSG